MDLEQRVEARLQQQGIEITDHSRNHSVTPQERAFGFTDFQITDGWRYNVTDVAALDYHYDYPNASIYLTKDSPLS
mgnify:CR=1 FL=1